ncbi:MAG: hypothetical protein Q9161_002056 [Pseudevernia consocians]
MTSRFSLRSPTHTTPAPIMPQTIAPAIAHVTSIPTKASYKIAVALPQDIPYLTTIQWAALTSNPLIKTLYPHGPTPALTAFTRNSYTKALQFPSVRIIKATDTDRGEIVAFAKWIKYPEEIPEPLEGQGGRIQSVGQAGGGGWSKGNIPSQKPDDVDKRALGDWNGVITQMRRGIMKNRRHTCRAKPDPCNLECYFGSIAPALWVLDILHTHPSHQGRGAGAQLVKWGIDLADKERLQCYLESSPAGYPLFKKCDFEDVTEMEIELNKYKDHRYGQYKYKHIVMIRPPNVPPKVPPKDLAIEKHPIGYWDFGLPTTAESSEIDNDSSSDKGPGAISEENRQYGIVGAVGGTMQEPFRPTSHFGILDTVSEGGEGVSRPTSHIMSGNPGEEPSRPVSLI